MKSDTTACNDSMQSICHCARSEGILLFGEQSGFYSKEKYDDTDA